MTTRLQQYMSTISVGFDLETSGVNVKEDRIVTAAIVMGTPANPTEYGKHEWLINPGVEIPEEAAAIHGITTEKARAEGMPADVAIREINDMLWRTLIEWPSRVLVAFNAPFDFSMLYFEVQRHNTGADGFVWGAPTPVVDPYVLDKFVDPYRKGSRKLVDMCKTYGVDLDEADAHEATADASAAVKLWPRILHGGMRSTNRDISGALQSITHPDTLHLRQIEWRRRQQRSLRDYFRKEGRPYDDVDEGWPLHTSITT